MTRVIPSRDDLLKNLRKQYDEGEEIHPHLEALLKANPPKPPKRKYGSIQWVIDAVTPPGEWIFTRIQKHKTHDPHKVDAFRADEDISWCPECQFKWNMYEGRVWKSRDVKLWKEKICPHCVSHVK